MVFPYPYPGPIALYNNLPINTSFYTPQMFFIQGISLGQTTTVSTTVNHDYVIGQLVRLIIPEPNGTYQLNEQQGYVIQIPSNNSLVINIDSSKYTPFQTSTYTVQPQILAIGDINSGNINASGNLATGTNIPGSFQNISPI